EYGRAKYAAEILRDNDPTDASRNRTVAILENRIGDAQAGLGRLDEALHAYRAAEKIIEGLLSTLSADETLYSDLILSSNNIGDLLVKQRNYEEARTAYEKGVSAARNGVRATPSSVNEKKELLALLNKLAGVNATLGRAEETVAVFKMARKLAQELILTD